VRQNLRMLLEQSQVALLSGNQLLYRESLERARHWVAEFFEADESAARALDRDIADMAQQAVSVELPDLSRSLRALDEAVAARLAQGGDDA
jgi:uroporphyrin-3 C-methyltransferase